MSPRSRRGLWTRPAQLGCVLLLAALGAALVQRDDRAWAARRATRWPAALRGGLFLKQEKSLEQSSPNGARREQWEDTVAIQNVVLYLRTPDYPVSYETWAPPGAIPQTGKMALVKLVRWESDFIRYGQPCTATFTTEAAAEDVPLDPNDPSWAVFWIEGQLSPGVWKVWTRATAPATGSYTTTDSCFGTHETTTTDVTVDARVEGTLRAGRRGRRQAFILQGERRYEQPAPGGSGTYLVHEQLSGTLFPVPTRRR